MKPFNLLKVIDPHQNMPNDIKRCLLDGIQEAWDSQGNDTFIRWRVGQYQYIAAAEGEEIEDYEPGDLDLKRVDDWMLENGLEKDEQVIVLYWW